MAANAYFWIVLATLAGFYALDFLANWLNLRSLESKLPPVFRTFTTRPTTPGCRITRG